MPTGELRLRMERAEGRSIVASQRHAGALRVLRPHYADGSGRPSLTVVNPGGGYLGGDDYRLEAALGSGAGLTLTTQSATKVYRTPQGPARMEQRFELEAEARFEFVPDSLIAFRGASYRQRTTVEMHPSASLVLAEVVTHGWSPDGAPFSFDEIAMSTRVTAAGAPIAIDRLRLRPAHDGTGALVLGGFSHLATLLVIDPRADGEAVDSMRDILDVRSTSPDLMVGITRLAAPGFMLRALTRSTPAANTILHTAIDWMREAWHSLPPLALRKH